MTGLRAIALAAAAGGATRLCRHHRGRHRGTARICTRTFSTPRSPSVSPRSSAPRARRSRSPRLAPPAPPRSSSASRRSGAAARPRRCASAPTVRWTPKPSSASRFFRRCPPRTRSPRRRRKPFSKNRDGFVMAEGAAALVLEDAAIARARGATILAYMRGCGEAADTFHRTRSNPSGEAIIRAMRGAIEDAGLSPDDIDYINAHGTGTPENDKMEGLGITEVFGARAGKVPVSSNKSMVGHTLTAAGAVEAVFSLLDAEAPSCCRPRSTMTVPDPALPLDVVPNQARRATRDAHAFQLLRLRRAKRLARSLSGARVMAGQTRAKRVLVTGGARGSARRSCAASAARLWRALHLAPLGRARGGAHARARRGR